jgi:hypothetical protein
MTQHCTEPTKKQTGGTMPSIPITWGKTCPHPDSLQTGDLVFPRGPASDANALLEAITAMPQLSELTANMRVAELLGEERLQLLRVRNVPAHTMPLEPVQPDKLAEQGRGGVFDPTNPAHLFLLVRILNATFGDLTEQWLGMTVKQFLNHPISRILTGAINQDLGGGFFVGHVGLILREPSGASSGATQPWVIEGNITDFSHYRVSIHPYYDERETTGSLPSGRMRGWVNYRTALGQQVWSGRPKAFINETPEVAQAREAIARHAKALLGRPYGFFDHPALGDTDRLYCSEFVLNVFRSVGTATLNLKVDDHRWWRWLLENLPFGAFRQQLEKALKEDGLYDRVINKEFFLLTVHMLWRSEQLAAQLKPGGEEYA